MNIRSRLWTVWGVAVALPLVVTALVVAFGARELNSSTAISQAAVEEVGPRFDHAARGCVDDLAFALTRLAEDHTLRMTDATIRPHDWNERVALSGMSPAPAWVRAFNLTDPRKSATTDRRSWRLLAAESPGGWRRLVAGRDSLEIGTLVEGNHAAIVVARFAVRDVVEQAMNDIGRAGTVSYFVADPERRRFIHHSSAGLDGKRVIDAYPDLATFAAGTDRHVVTTTPHPDLPSQLVWARPWNELGVVVGVSRAENVTVPGWLWTKRGLLAVLIGCGILSFVFVLRTSLRVHEGFSALGDGVEHYTAGDLAHRLQLFGEDEFGELGRELNVMAESWDRRQLAEMVAARYDTLRRVRLQVEDETADVRSGIEALGRNLDTPEPSPILVRGVGRVLNRLADQLREVEGLVAEPETRSETASTLDPAGVQHFLERTIRDSGVLTDGRVHITVRVNPELDSIAVTDAHLRRTLLAAIDNARKAMPRGGELLLEAQRCGDDVVMSVADSGVGMSEFFLRQHLFRPFAGEWESGEGLGLSLVEARDALRRRGGDIEVSSREGVGTRVDVRSPVASFERYTEPRLVPHSRVG